MARMRVQETVRVGRYRPGNGEAAGAYTGHKLYVLVLHRSTAPVACTWPVSPPIGQRVGDPASPQSAAA
jgi:hypothetical protein